MFAAATTAAYREDTGCLIETLNKKAEARARQKPTTKQMVDEGSVKRLLILGAATMQTPACKATISAFAWMTTLSLNSGREGMVEISGAIAVEPPSWAGAVEVGEAQSWLFS